MKKRNILLGVTGSVSAFKAAALVSKLVQEGFDVRVVLSSSAKKFIGEATFEGLTRNQVVSDLFAAGDAMAHIDLARWAELTLIYPASGNTLTKLAHGRAEDLIGTLFMAHDFKTPYWIVPAMNPAMLSHPAVVESISKLRSWGVEVFEADSGRMACGEVGAGRLVEPESMLTKIRDFFSTVKSGDQKNKILVTAGGTSEPIDPVRVLTNVSSGETGVRIANTLQEQGNEVTLLISESSPFRAEVNPRIRILSYQAFSDLDRKMKEELGEGDYTLLVHAAAVSDYRVERIEGVAGNAISSNFKIHSKEPLLLYLSPNPKILDRVREYAKNPKLRVVSFKLATPENGQAADLSGYDSDLIVYNETTGIERGTNRHVGEIYERTKDGYQVRSRFETKMDLARAIHEAVSL